MKKALCLVLSLCLLMSVFCTPVAAAKAAAAPSEIKTAKIVIDSKLCAYNTLLSGKTLLVPAQQIGKGIGILDAKKITYDSKKKTVTMVNGKSTLVLTVGSTTATLNGKKVTLDAAPYIYKNTPYVPAKSVAQSFGRKVVEDTSINVVAITTNASFNEVKSIMTKSWGVTNSSNTLSVNSNVTTEVNGEKVVVDQVLQRNKKDMAIYLKLSSTANGVTTVEEDYFNKDTAYVKMNDKWYIKEMDMKTFMQGIQLKDNNINLDISDLVIALLTKVPSKSKDQIVLQGDLFCKELMDATKALNGAYTKLNVKYTIDSKTMNLIGVDINASINIMGVECKVTTAQKLDTIDQNYKIVVPQEAKKGTLID